LARSWGGLRPHLGDGVRRPEFRIEHNRGL
jgi:hypothetical protein